MCWPSPSSAHFGAWTMYAWRLDPTSILKPELKPLAISKPWILQSGLVFVTGIWGDIPTLGYFRLEQKILASSREESILSSNFPVFCLTDTIGCEIRSFVVNPVLQYIKWHSQVFSIFRTWVWLSKMKSSNGWCTLVKSVTASKLILLSLLIFECKRVTHS